MSGRNTIGFILIALGIILLLNYYGVSIFNEWWPLILVILGVFILFRSPRLPASGLILVLIGCILQAMKLDIIPSEIVIPIILIAVGAVFIISRIIGKSMVNNDDWLNYFAIFSGLQTRSHSSAFKGGHVTALFGGAEIDLYGAQLSPEGASLDLSAIFGGVEVRVPEDWTVVATGVPLFGGYENKAKSTAVEDGKPVLKVNCLALFGGVEIQN